MAAQSGKGMENEYVVRPLMRPQVREVYNLYMTEDFPPDELKPLHIIEKGLDSGKYACYGFFNGQSLAAYAFLITSGKDVLIDYYSVEKTLRDRGLGSRFLKALIDGPLKESRCALLEIDDPDHATDPREGEKRMSRLRFYERNGLKDTKVRSAVHHVDYRVLVLPVGSIPFGQDALSIYLSIYHSMLAGTDFEKKLQIEGRVVE